LIAEDGSVGLGEVFVWLPETGLMPEQVIATIGKGLSQYLISESPFNVERIRDRMDKNVKCSEVAKGLLDMACYDLMGKITGRPAHDFMGGAAVTEIPLAALIPLVNIDFMVFIADIFFKDGIRTLRLKLGNNIKEDIQIMTRMREVFGDEPRMRVDYNQAYSPAEAVKAIKSIEEFNIDIAEQPVRAEDYMGMRYVQQRVDTPLMCHEGCFSLKDIITLVELGAVGVIGINAERPGGVTNALRAINYAEQKGLGVVVHNQSLGISSAMHLHLSAAKHYSIDHATELFGYVMMENDLLVTPIDYSGGTAKLPTGPGWGVELDEDSLKKYAVNKTVVIKTV
jgi:muconate cycloisomerase